MKLWRNRISIIMAFIMALTFLLSGSIQVFAHSSLLEVEYDNCNADGENDSSAEMWYVLGEGTACEHLSHETLTIDYRFSYNGKNGTDTWETYVTPDVAKEIKNAFAKSMKKWNNVYFYTYDSAGVVTKHKIINIVECVDGEPNLIIYPTTYLSGIAGTIPSGNRNGIADENGTTHTHCSEWEMVINLNYFYVNGSMTEEDVELIRERNGAHEMGHILGLLDVENYCNASEDEWHHHELLMGYGEPVTDRMSDITYKDIAGVAITRGFHTDDDHQWLNCGVQSNGKYKWICAICNGTKVALSTGFHPTYGSCGDNHDLADGNMMAVASYGTKDYYKCKYCRYVASFDDNAEQNYVRTYVDVGQDLCYNDVVGLGYTTYAPHDYTYAYANNTSHYVTCGCGYNVTAPHCIKRTELVNNRYGQCIDCGAIIDMGSTILPVNPFNAAKVSVNGSFILPNGIIILADEDVEAYKNGTLVFYNPDELPVTQ